MLVQEWERTGQKYRDGKSVARLFSIMQRAKSWDHRVYNLPDVVCVSASVVFHAKGKVYIRYIDMYIPTDGRRPWAAYRVVIRKD